MIHGKLGWALERLKSHGVLPHWTLPRPSWNGFARGDHRARTTTGQNLSGPPLDAARSDSVDDRLAGPAGSECAIRPATRPLMEQRWLTAAGPQRAVLFALGAIELYRPMAEALLPQYATCALLIPSDQPLTPASAESTSVARLAGDYLATLRRQCPCGPYHLMGSSLNGLIVFEAARQLEAQGETVETLLLLDAVLPSAWERSLPGRLRRALVRRWHFWRGCQRQCRNAYNSRLIAKFDRRLRPYTGKVILVLARNRAGARVQAEQRSWQRHCRGELITIEAPGTHLSIIDRNHAQALAQRVETQLNG